MKKILSVVLTLCFAANISFAAFDPYADEEIEKKSYKKLYYGIVLTLLGGFLVYDGFSKVEDDVSRPSVDYTTVLHSEWTHDSSSGAGEANYILNSGYSSEPYYPYSDPDTGPGPAVPIEQNVLYNNGNVDLKNIVIEVRYNNQERHYIKDRRPDIHLDNGAPTSDGYHCPSNVDGKTSYQYRDENDELKSEIVVIKNLKKGEHVTWHDIWKYRSDDSKESSPLGSDRIVNTDPNPAGLHLGKDAIGLMDIRVKLNKNQQYKPIYHKRNKCDAEGVAGILVGLTGIYFIVDHFLDMHKFNAYARRHQLNLKVATASNEYKLMLQKRI